MRPAEDFPFPEATFVCSGSRGNNLFVDLLLHREEISAECIRGLRAARFQDRTCGYVTLKCAISSLSDRFHKREASSAMEFVPPEMWVTVEINRYNLRWSANRRSKYATCESRDTDPLRDHATDGVLSQQVVILRCRTSNFCAQMSCPPITPHSSASEFLMSPRELTSLTQQDWMSTGNGWRHTIGSDCLVKSKSTHPIPDLVALVA